MTGTPRRIQTTFWPMLGRGLLRRCPRCGSFRAWFRRWLVRRPRCRACGYRYERQPGFSLGATTVNMIVTFGLVVAALVAGVILSYPDLAIARILAVTVPVAVVVPIVFYPVSYTVWAAIDLAMRPLEPVEAADADAAARASAARTNHA